jgi:hypothetical protein
MSIINSDTAVSWRRANLSSLSSLAQRARQQTLVELVVERVVVGEP